jgi:hypothetical protein
MQYSRYPVFEGRLASFGHGGNLGQESWFQAHGLVVHGFRAHGLHVMKHVKGLRILHLNLA